MAGPAIRAWQIAIALSREHDVELVSTLACELTHPDFATGFADAANLPALVDRSDIIVFQGNLMAQHPVVRTTSNIVVVDIYDPFHLEVLEQSKGLAPVDRLRLVAFHDARAQRAARSRRLLPVREPASSATSGSVSSRAWGGSTTRPTTLTRTCDH